MALIAARKSKTDAPASAFLSLIYCNTKAYFQQNGLTQHPRIANAQVQP